MVELASLVDSKESWPTILAVISIFIAAACAGSLGIAIAAGFMLKLRHDDKQFNNAWREIFRRYARLEQPLSDQKKKP